MEVIVFKRSAVYLVQIPGNFVVILQMQAYLAYLSFKV